MSALESALETAPEGYFAWFARPAGTIEDVTFTVGQVNGDWRVTDVEPNYPHPSRAVMLKVLNDNLSKANDATAKTVYQHAISDLQVPSSAPSSAQ